MFGLVTSRAVVSIGIVAMFANILLYFFLEPQQINIQLKKYVNEKKLLSLSFLFFAALLAWFYSTDKERGLDFLLNKLPLFVVPLAISIIPYFSKKWFHRILLFYITSILAASTVVIYHYFSAFEASNIAILQGKAIWVPFNHIQFNLMLVFAFVSLVYLYFRVEKDEHLLGIYFYTYRLVLLVSALFIFVLIHILSVRTGILVLYLSIIFALLFYIVKTKKVYLLFIGIFFLTVLPFIAYNSIESFRNKVNYMQYDWQQYQKNEYGSNSDARRIVSLKIGWVLAKKHFPLGVGTGSLENHMQSYYQSTYPNILGTDRISPHNQFLYTLIDYGLLGFIGLIVSLFYPIFTTKVKKKQLFYILFLVITCTPLLYEISLEMQLGISFFAVFSALFIKQIIQNDAHA